MPHATPALVTSPYKAYESYISPDGSWLLQVSPGAHPTYVARSLDSTKAVQWPWDGQTAYSVAWLSDSCRFVEIENCNGQLSAVVRDVKIPKQHVVKPIPNSTQAAIIESVGGPNSAASVNESPIDDTTPDPMQVTVCRFSVVADDKPADTFVVKAPRESDFWYAVPSHDCTRLAFVVHYLVPAITIRIGLPPWRVSHRVFESLWESDITGAHMREIGRYEKVGPHTAIGDVQWLPSDRGISYIAKNSLWTVPVE